MRSDGFTWIAVMRRPNGGETVCGPFASWDEAHFVGTAEDNDFRIWERVYGMKFDRVAELREFHA
jgi:hypothetical protein